MWRGWCKCPRLDQDLFGQFSGLRAEYFSQALYGIHVSSSPGVRTAKWKNRYNLAVIQSRKMKHCIECNEATKILYSVPVWMSEIISKGMDDSTWTTASHTSASTTWSVLLMLKRTAGQSCGPVLRWTHTPHQKIHLAPAELHIQINND